MRAIKWILTAVLAVTAVLYVFTGILEHASSRDEGPVIHCPEGIHEVSVFADDAALLAGVTAEDAQDGDLTGEVIVGGISQLIGGNTAKVTLLVFDQDDNMASWIREICYTDYRRPAIGLTEPLEFESKNDARLLSRITVTDVVDGDISDQARVSSLWATERENVYSATVMVTNSLGDNASVEVPVIIRGGSSDIRLRRQLVYLKQGGEFDPMDYVASDKRGLTVRHEVDMLASGCYWVWYEDGSGDFAILTVVVE